MQTLIIGSLELKLEIESILGPQTRVLWAQDLLSAFKHLESSDIDLVVIDMRAQETDVFTDLRALIFGTPVTTRVMAIVEQLPEDEIFVESGVIYLTPPVNLEDINWFIRHQAVSHTNGR